MWSRPHTLALAVTLYAVGYAMCAGAQDVTTFVAGQLIYTLGNSGITFRKSVIVLMVVSAEAGNSQQSYHCRHHFSAMAGFRQWRHQPTLCRQRLRRWVYHQWCKRLQCGWMAMGCESMSFYLI